MDVVLIILITLIFSALFSGMEIAFLTANKLKIELDNKQGVFTAKLLSGFIKSPSRFIGTMLVGNNIALVFYGVFMAQMLETPLQQGFGLSNAWTLILQTLISTLIILVTGEFLPKTLFRINPNFILQVFAIPLRIIYFILFLPMIIMVGLSEFILKYIFRVEASRKALVFGRVDLDNYVREITRSAESKEEEMDHEIQIFQNALDFSKVKARDCMIPRTEIVAVEVEDELGQLRELFIETGLSKVLVYRDTIDNIIGYVNSVALFDDPPAIKNLILPVIIIPETIPANQILELFISQSKSIAVVVDEYGGTSGMLTMEDIIEEIFGDIEDEHDKEEFIEDKISDTEFLLSARLEIDYLNDKFKLDIPESDEYETLAGFILYNHEDIPDKNSVVQIDNFYLVIKEVSDARIEVVHLILKDFE